MGKHSKTGGTKLKEALIKAGYQEGGEPSGSIKQGTRIYKPAPPKSDTTSTKPLVQMTMGGGADMIGALIEGSQAAMAKDGKEIYGMGGSYRSKKKGKKKKK